MACPCRPLCLVPKPDCRQRRRRLSAHHFTASGIAGLAAELPMFQGLGASVLRDLTADARLLTLGPEQPLFAAGTRAECFYILLDGQVKLSANTPDGRETVVEVLLPVSSFGEAAMLAMGRFPLDAAAIGSATLIRVGRAAFVETLCRNHAPAWRMLANLTRWNQRLASDLRRLRQMPAWRRVVEYLLALTDAPAGEVVVSLPFKKEVLASRIGIRRESLSRVLAKLRQLGVRTEGRAFRIADIGQLRRDCG
jgi:CRP-like cAMP-binding protein